MIREALELIQKTAVTAEGIGKSFTLNGKHYLWDGKEWKAITIDPPHRSHRVESLDSFLAACEAYGENGTIWHSDDEVVLVVDDNKRDETVTLGLDPSPQWCAYLASGGKGYSPAAARHFLLRKLAGCVTEGLPARFGRVSFSRKSDGRADIDHQKESLGRSVESQVSSTDDLPDVISCSIPVYTTPGVREPVSVLLACDIHFEKEQFAFEPVAGEVAMGMSVVQAKLKESLEASGLPVFNGKP